MATRVSNTHPPNGPQATQNQKRETQSRNLEGQKSIICKKILMAMMNTHPFLYWFTFKRILPCEEVELVPSRQCEPSSLFQSSQLLSVFKNPLFYVSFWFHTRAVKYAIVDSTGLSLWSLDFRKFVAHGREGLRRQTRRFGCALSTAADPGGRSRPLCSSWP